MIFLPSPLAAWTESDAAAQEYLGRGNDSGFRHFTAGQARVDPATGAIRAR
jgi:hypothetical protein